MLTSQRSGDLKSTNPQVSIRVLLIASLLVILAGAVLVPSFDWQFSWRAFAQSQTQSTAGSSAAETAAPASLQQSEATINPSSAGRQVLISFSELPIYTTVTNQYPDAVFSSDSAHYVITTPQNYGSSLPNISRAYVNGWWIDGNPPYDHFAPLVIDFPQPINDLAFHVLASDSLGGIARVDVYQGGNWTATEPIFGNASPFSPIWYTGISSYKNVSRIVVNQIADRKGLAFDNFSFTVPPAPTPTPTPIPSPTPPPPPTEVKATPDENELILSWTPSSDGASYVIKRVTSGAQTNSAAPENTAFVAIEPSVSCQPVNGRCFYEDLTANDSETTYSYVIAAANSFGTSADSNPPANGSPLSNACSEREHPTKTPPAPGPAGFYGWDMHYDFSAQDGLVISDVSLNGKRMAKRMSVPYFKITTNKSGTFFGPTRGELKPAGSPTGIRSRLIDFGNGVDPQRKKLVVFATYAIDRIPGTPKACLSVTQKYEFYDAGASPEDSQGPCEPSDTVHPCHKFRPMIDYDFAGGPGEALSSLNMPIRLHFQDTVASGNTVALTKDLDRKRDVPFNLSQPFKYVFNPLTNAWWSQVFVMRDKDHPDKLPHTKYDVDNFHQTNNLRRVSLPGANIWLTPSGPDASFRVAGCPECVHFHWRWASFTPQANFGYGAPLLPAGSDQAVDIQVNPYKGDEHPNDYYRDVFNPNDRLRNPTKGVNQPYDVVLWYSPTGFAPHDSFFWHTAWFTPIKVDASTTTTIERSSSTSSNDVSSPHDGPVSVDFGSIYETGSTTFDQYDLSTMPALPAGFAPLNNTGYLIATNAVVGGPHVVHFKAESVTDQTDFSNVRIFYAEPDPFDPEKPMWTDATILSPNLPAPDFSNKILSARTDDLGLFAIGKLVQTPPALGTANLRLSSTDSQDPITAGNNLTYTVTVTNDGPQTATEVMLRNSLSPDVELVSSTPSQGTCKELDGEIYCSLNSLTAGNSATLTLIVKPTEGAVSFPAGGRMIANSAVVRAKEIDNDPSNDLVSEDTNVLPSPNHAPSVSFTSPLTGAMLVGPLNLTLSAQASDSDGSIARVDFYDNDLLVGTSTSGSPYSITETNVPCGNHNLIAVATDNGGRQNAATADVIVNGSATVSITSPSSKALFTPGSTINLAANASSSSGISKVEFFANSGSIGEGSAVTWSNVSAGFYSIIAVATDSAGVTTMSTPVEITVDSPPTVTMTLPANGAIFPSLTNISVSANAHSNTASITRVDFYADGLLIGSANDVGTDKFSLTWRHLADGFHSLTAVATDNLGFSTTSAPITIGVNTPSTQPGEFIWFDDDVPVGAVKHADGDADWYWVDANPVALSGSKAHQSRNFAELDAPNTSFHQHYFDGATTTLPLVAGDRLFTYVFLDINDMPREIMLQWKDANSWEHRAYWGENRINAGTEGTSSRRYMGLMPEAGQWVRLEVPADQVGLEGATLTGMSFSLDGGRATWDLAGKVTANFTPPPATPGGDSVWMEDGLPAGAVTSTVNDVWDWVSNLSPYGLAHRSFVSVSHNTPVYRSHSFTGAQTPMQVNPGDVLFTYVWIDPAAKPDEIMLQWYDGSSWEHRAFWGENFIGQLSRSLGVQGTESQRYMGGVPLAGTWYRLEIPASYVGLEGKSVSGMAFSLYGKEPTVAWDRSGKRFQLTTIPLTLSPISGVWKLFNKTYGYAYETNDQGAPGHAPTQSTQSFYVHPNQAAGTVPMYRFRRPNSDNLEYFYSQSRSYDGNGWVLDGTAFYVYPDAGTTGTTPLYLYHDNQTHYLLIINQAEATGMALDGIVGYVYPTNGLVPVPPSSPMWDNGCNITWKDNSQNESAFEVYKDAGTWPLSMVPVATLAPNVTSFNICPLRPELYYVRAVNSFGHSKWVDTCTQCAFSGPPSPPNSTSTVDIVAPTEGEVVSRNFAITANSFDNDGNGTIAKVEFFANGNKLGELSEAPFIFVWNNAVPGTYSLTAITTDTAGATATSSAVSVTVGKSDQTITFDPISAKSYGDAPFTVNATASSGLPATFTIVSGPATVSGNTVTITGVGSVTVRASQVGDANFNVAPDVDHSFSVAKGSATITFSNLSQTYDGSAKPVTATTNPAGLSGLSISYNGSGTAPTSVGSYSVLASLANDNYTASDASGTLTIGKASQTITFDQPANKTYGDASFGLNATSSSNLPVSLSIVSGPATILGSTVSLNGAGTVTVRASQSGNANYNAASDVDRSFTVAKASATITLTNLNQNYDGTPRAVTATTNPAGLTGVAIKYNGSSTAPSNAGSYSVVASLTNDNYAATDATGTLIINAPPTVSVTSPTNGALLHATSVTISASAADSDGTVSKVEFFQGSVKLGQALSAPFSFVWNNVAGGSYSLTAVATDNSGASTVSSPVSITVNNPPNVSVTASSPQDVPTAPAQISIIADASDADGTISKVDFYQGTTLLATDVTSPYSYTWSNVAAGNYSITAKATDNLGGVTTSNVVGVSVNAKPNVSLASPANGASFFAPALVSLNATASDSDGSISKVEFYQGSTLISTVTATPYSFNWSYVPAGTYTLTAKATDNNGASTTSNSVSITVTPSSVAIGKIAFASNRDGCAQIYQMNTDGTGQTCLSNGASNDESPKWSPDNSRIVFQSDRDFQNDGDNSIYGMDIYVMNWDGSGVSRLTSSAYDDIAPVWSPDGTKIAFQSFRNGLNFQIYAMNADGSGQVNISNNNANETQPSWSPDGTKIAFASDRDQAGFSSIYVMNANGSNQTRVTLSGTGFRDEQPAWSPDGMRLAFITTRDSTVVTWDEWLQGQLVVKTKLLINKEVYVMNADGSSQIRLTNIMGNDDSPVWSPDGTKIAFRSDRDRNCCDPSEQIWMMNADGSNQVNLSNNQFGDHCPSWSR